jgi:hypothetical protein
MLPGWGSVAISTSVDAYVQPAGPAQRANWRKAQAIELAQLPAEEAYRAAVADMASVLEGANVEAARAAVRSLTGDIPVFEKGGKLYGRLTVDAAPLFGRRNPGIIEQVGNGGGIQLRATEVILALAAWFGREFSAASRTARDREERAGSTSRPTGHLLPRGGSDPCPLLTARLHPVASND